MAGSLHCQTPHELFKELVEEAIAHQKLSPSEESSSYLVELLTAFILPERLYAEVGAHPDETLAEILCRAIRCEGMRRFACLKFAGDLALFMTGFFSDSFNRRLVDVDYYGRLGGYAYGTASDLCHNREAGALFAELAANFNRFVDVLTEVSEVCVLTDDANLMRLYERWLRNGSERLAASLRRHGVLVVPGSLTVH